MCTGQFSKVNIFSGYNCRCFLFRRHLNMLTGSRCATNDNSCTDFKGVNTTFRKGLQNLVEILCPPAYSPSLIKIGRKLFDLESGNHADAAHCRCSHNTQHVSNGRIKTLQHICYERETRHDGLCSLQSGSYIQLSSCVLVIFKHPSSIVVLDKYVDSLYTDNVIHSTSIKKPTSRERNTSKCTFM